MSQPQQTQPIIKNLLIKDASGNTQLIEVIQTAPGKFMTASGHSIKTSVTASGGKTIIRAGQVSTSVGQAVTSAGHAATSAGQTVTTAGEQPTNIQPVLLQPIVTTGQIWTGPQITTIMKGGPARQLLTIPIQQTLIQPSNIKTEFGTTPQQQHIIQRSGQQILTSPMMQQIIQAGNQRLLLTQTPNGPQLTPITSSHPLSQQLLTSLPPSSPTNTQQLAAGPTLNITKQFISPILDHTGARKRIDFPSDVNYESKRRKAEKGGKGLRHFSMKVCEKVRNKGLTTYNEVADELVQEFASPAMGLSSIEQQFDQKNIRRRVYDALNVLMAMNIISKEKKEIKWLGLPTNSMQECTTLEKDRQKRIDRLKAKTQQLHDLIIQQVAFKSLVERNKIREKEVGPPAPHGSIHLPFLIVNTAKQTVIDCSISNDKMEYLFNFDGTFEIHDDIEVLKRMGLALGLEKGECTDESIAKAKQVLPKSLEMYIDQIGKRNEDWRAEFNDLDFEESYFNNESESVFEGGLSLATDGEEISMSMSVEDLEMQAAIDSLHQGEIGEEIGDEDSYGEGEGDDDEMSD